MRTFVVALVVVALVAPALASLKEVLTTLDAALDPTPTLVKRSASHLVRREAEDHRRLAKRQASNDGVSQLQLRDTFRQVRQLVLSSVQAGEDNVLRAALSVGDAVNRTLNDPSVIGDQLRSLAYTYKSQLDAILAGIERDSVLPRNCGKIPSVTANDLSSGTLPWTAQIGYKSERGTGYTLTCLAAIISPLHLAVDAICAANEKGNTVLLNSGDTRRIVRRFIHSDIRSAEDLQDGYNVGIILVDRPMQFSDTVQPICLPDMLEQPNLGKTAQAVVVGIEEQGGRVVQYSWVRSNTLWPGQCHSLLRELSPNNIFVQELTFNHLCVLRPQDQVDISLLVQVDGKSGRAVLLGLGPLSDPTNKVPTVYTSTQPNRVWYELMAKNLIPN